MKANLEFRIKNLELRIKNCFLAGSGYPLAGIRRFAGSLLSTVIIATLFLLTVTVSAEAPYTAVRKPIFAGSFYPADKHQLEKKIDGYLKEAVAKSEKIPSQIFGVISPHAGYEYSGQVAAYGYNQIKGKDYKTVIIIGSSHQVPFKGISIYPSGSWETPLGNVQIDRKIAQYLMDNCKSVKVYPAAFTREHSLEVQVPFLQRSLKSFTIVPLITGSLDGDDYKNLSDALLKLLKENPKDILIVASSDMSHFHSYNKASQMDKLALKDIDELNIEKLFENLYNANCELCGAPGVITLMMVASKLNGQAKTLYYANSGDVTRDKNRVVGYGAVAFMYPDKSDSALSKQEQNTLLMIARKTLDEYISKGNIPQFDIKAGKLLEKRGVFVTLTKNHDLRGCIGYIVPVAPLYKAVIEMTVSASTRDPRFPPVSKGELKDINIEISALTPLKLISDPADIEVGKHGLYITKGNYSGLLLPQVATEHKWNREEFLRQTCIKAGLPQNAWKDKGTSIYTFMAQIFSE
ncbi:MAG: AmmeMemoRadiSam system protein B [Proteobacteria bacterium]|nr:AmmeMemoRadiSam system protein B [Pseudomonadota bacterium]